MQQSISIVRYKKDLRISDHKPLYEASIAGLPIIGLYVREPEIIKAKDYSHFHQYRIQESVKELKANLKKIGIPLYTTYQGIQETLDHIQKHYHIAKLYAHEETGNAISYTRDKNIIQYCKKHNISFTEYPNNGIVRRLESRDIRDTIRKKRMLDTIITNPLPQTYRHIHTDLEKYSRRTFEHFTKATKPLTRTSDFDIPGEQGAHKRLHTFLHKSYQYLYAVSQPEKAIHDSSRLSAYLTYGNISMKQVYQMTINYKDNIKEQIKNKTYTGPSPLRALNAFIGRLHRRCHFIQKLESWPHIEYKNQNPTFDQIRQESNHTIIEKRTTGQTGVPMVDAGMRCLAQTGWINFRMRAMLTSFICNTCMQPRQSIGDILARYFVDYEPGIHYSQLQMQSGTTGINTIRIYNPIKQLQEKDNDLHFIHRRIPELKDVAKDTIKVLGTTLGNSIITQQGHPYPVAILDISTANQQARKILRSHKRSPESKQAAQKVLKAIGSRKKHQNKKQKDRQAISLFE